jgi:tRNA threonylcarbamoyladenosine biosynthesis protein TsaB
MKILAMELSTGQGSLAWSEEETKTVQSREWPNDRKNSAKFFEEIQTTVQQFGLPDRIIVGLGPGSYAGIRIAISAAFGVATAARAQLIGYPSVCAMQNGDDEYAVVGDARRQSFFFVRIAERGVVNNYELLTTDELRTRLKRLPANLPVFSSDLLPQFQPGVEQRYPSAEILVQLAAESQKKFVKIPLEPIYLRDAHVTMPKRNLRETIQ